jgi:hypothetical protein
MPRAVQSADECREGCRVPKASCRHPIDAPIQDARRGRVTVSIRLESSEFTEKYSYTILAASIRCYFIPELSIMKLASAWFFLTEK